VGESYSDAELTELDHFLTARWALFAQPIPGVIWWAPAQHPQWNLKRARAIDIDDRIVTAAGLPQPSGEPLVHFSETVKVRVGWPRL
jgi:uncharacterized protein YqjF (DUF2071 family)